MISLCLRFSGQPLIRPQIGLSAVNKSLFSKALRHQNLWNPYHFSPRASASSRSFSISLHLCMIRHRSRVKHIIDSFCCFSRHPASMPRSYSFHTAIPLKCYLISGTNNKYRQSNPVASVPELMLPSVLQNSFSEPFSLYECFPVGMPLQVQSLLLYSLEIQTYKNWACLF